MIKSPFSFGVCNYPTIAVMLMPDPRMKFVSPITFSLRLLMIAIGDKLFEPHIIDEDLSYTIMFCLSLTIVVFNFFLIDRFLGGVKDQNVATSNFLSVVSHELRTPLAAIIGLRDLIDETKDEKERKALLDAITANAECLSSIVDTILLITKMRTTRDEMTTSRRRRESSSRSLGLKSGDLAVSDSAVVCSEVVAKACSVVCDSKLLQQNVQLLSECTAARVDGLYEGFGNHLQQMLLIALTNACKYTSKGRIVVRADVFGRNNVPASGDEASDETGRSVLRAAQWATHLLRIDIEDTGVGIAAGNRERVFEPFFREEHSGTSGVGLGLPLMRSMLESLMSGSVVVGEPKRVGGGAGGPGTRVTMLLPCAVQRSVSDSGELGELVRVDHSIDGRTSHDARLIATSDELLRYVSTSVQSGTEALVPSISRTTAQIDDSGASGSSRLVLVADDSAILRRIAQRKLEKAGASVLLATDGTSALESAIARYFDLSLIVLDESMPGMSGVEVAMALRDYTRTSGVERAVPVVIYSAHNPKDIGVMKSEDNDDMERFCRRIGIVEWCQKAMKRSDDVWQTIASRAMRKLI